jgi:hypothetical protein
MQAPFACFLRAGKHELSFSAHPEWTDVEKNSMLVRKLSMVACAFTKVRRLYAFRFLTMGSVGTGAGTPLGPDIDADDFVSRS